MKRAVTIQDISCVGKCSLTVALPIISAMGVETAVIPTAVLSTHTAFQGFTFRDLTEDILPIADHWKKEKFDFDALYTGYPGSKEQIAIVGELFDRFGTDRNLIMVDPAMADNGKLYAGFTPEFAKAMAGLCAKADVIVPNLTEASFLLDIPYPGETYTRESIREILVNLTKLGAKKAVLTGISFAEKELGAVAYDSETDSFIEYFNEKLPVSFHGTGDIFASVCVGALLNGFDLEKALTLSVDYTLEAMRYTMKDPDHRWYGVNFESAIPMLVKRLEKEK